MGRTAVNYVSNIAMIGMLEQKFLRFDASGRVNVYLNARIFQFAKQRVNIVVKRCFDSSFVIQFPP